MSLSSLVTSFSPFCPPFFRAQARAHCRVAVATLNTLAGYIDWVSLVHITSGNCHLLEILCLLLSEPELQLEAAECLLIAISRKVSYRENTCAESPCLSHNTSLIAVGDFFFFQSHFFVFVGQIVSTILCLKNNLSDFNRKFCYCSVEEMVQIYSNSTTMWPFKHIYFSS